MMTASILIVTYNNADDIGPCLTAVQQHSSLPVEIIIFDNASEDETCEIVQADFPEVRLIQSQENLGFAQGNNQAVSHAQADILVFLNPDTAVQPDWLPPLIAALQDPDVGAVTPQLLFADPPETINACGNQVHFSGLTTCLYLGKKRLTTAKPFAVGAVSGAAFAMRKTVFARLNGFAGSFFMYFEDTDLSLRLYQLGYHILVVPASRVEHDYQPAFSGNKVYFLERNRYLSLLGLLPWRWLVLMFPVLLWTELVSWGYAFLQGKTAVKAKVRAWRDIWQRRAWVRRRRHQYANLQTAVPLIQHVFTARLEANYTTEHQGLARIVTWGAWLTAAPFLKIARILSR